MIPKCVTCLNCKEGKLVEDKYAMFLCEIYKLFIPAVLECKDYKKEFRL